jgi:hypothetical protein
MFVQVMTGTTCDPDALHERLEIWKRDLQPGAIGYMGSTSGCTSDGDVIMLARFEDRAAAQSNSDRPEQGRWWEETAKCFDGPVTFHDTEDVELASNGDLERATFVQVMEGTVADRARAMAIEREMVTVLSDMRPDVLGHLTAYFEDDQFDDFVYFTSEAEARAAESAQLPSGVRAQMEEMNKVARIDRYIDLTQPWMIDA